MHSDFRPVVVQEARIGVPAAEGAKATELPGHGGGRGQSVVATPDKVGHYACCHFSVVVDARMSVNFE